MRSVLVASVAVALAAGLCALVDHPLVYRLAGIAFVVQWVAFAAAYALRTERFYDLVGGLTYLTLAVVVAITADELSGRAWVMLACVAIWSSRLGWFLALRVHRAGNDRRFDEIKHSATRFLMAWTLQGLWTFLTPLAVWMVATRPVHEWTVLDGIGLSLWLVGFGIEVVSDAQKSRFRAAPENHGRFIQSGLWAWSRHPNYFGEILLWIGLFVSAASQLTGAEWLAVLAPVFVYVLLRHGSGVPLLEASAEERWGDDPEYREYVERTPVLVLRPPR